MPNRTLKLAPLDLPLALFLFSAFLGLWPAYDRSQCWSTLIALSAGCLLYVLVSRLAVSRRWWRAIAVIIVFASVLLSLYFITQYDHFGYPEKIRAIDRLGALIGKVVPPAIVWIPVDNGVAAFLEGGFFLVIGLTLTSNRWWGRAGGAICASLITLALLMSTARGAWLAVLATTALWSALHWRPMRVAVSAGALLALGLTIYTIVQGDIMALNDIPVANRILAPIFIRPDRLDVYRNSVYLVQDFPLTGIGLGGQFARVHSQYALLIQHVFLSCSHNLYLEVWLEQGLVGAISLLWLMAALYQAAHTHTKPSADLLYQSTWLGLTAIFIHGVTDARQYVDLWCWFPFFGLLGLNAATTLRRTRAKTRGRQWILPASVAGVFLIIVAVSLHPLTATWHANLGCVLQARGELLETLNDGQRATLRQQAEEHYRRAIQIAPHDRTAQQRLGLMLVDEARFQEGVEHLEIAWQADPENTTTHKGLGLAYVWVGQLEKARPLLQNVPDVVYELNIWGGYRATLGQVEQSLNAYRMSLLLEPDQPAVQEKVEQIEQSSAP
ncbi:MAG: hypothetical protein DRJ03_12255 [Chloroflexi bacterium]|nr:MAG: hypothetical protein B6I35_09625 [Anaerolineaceae bacterium 4572_32.2]RLC79376.1 MAG: hypothetical protein DRI81_05395 [Chloroflexota bacterium]RLC85240.1 MAG: hypothetical protein DRJ03_12255 [Chloroflexota bacterium]HEY73198.1 hypothetical protein [Thermoflexia bacterium]